MWLHDFEKANIRRRRVRRQRCTPSRTPIRGVRARWCRLRCNLRFDMATDRVPTEGSQRSRRRRLGPEGFSSGRRSVADMDNVTQWTDGILALPEIRPWRNFEHIDENARIHTLRKIAAVNIKKTPGGDAANVDGLRAFVRATREFLRPRLDLHRPDVIVGCGSDVSTVLFEELNGDTEWHRSMRGTRYTALGSATYFGYYHPAAPVSASLPHYGLIDSVSERAGAWIAESANPRAHHLSRQQPR